MEENFKHRMDIEQNKLSKSLQRRNEYLILYIKLGVGYYSKTNLRL